MVMAGREIGCGVGVFVIQHVGVGNVVVVVVVGIKIGGRVCVVRVFHVVSAVIWWSGNGADGVVWREGRGVVEYWWQRSMSRAGGSVGIVGTNSGD